MLKLNSTRTFPSPVTVHFVDEKGKSSSGTFNAVFKVVPTDQLTDENNSEKRLLDVVLVEVSNIELTDEQGEALTGDALLEACKSDPSISSALTSTYGKQLTKKNLK